MKARLAEILLNDMDSHRFNASMNVRLHATPQYIKGTDISNTIPIFSLCLQPTTPIMHHQPHRCGPTMTSVVIAVANHASLMCMNLKWSVIALP